MTAKAHLHDATTGEVQAFSQAGAEDAILRLRDHVAELQRTIAAQSHTIGELKRDKLKDAESKALWPLAMKWHAHHNKVTGRKSRWKLDCFERCEPYLKEYGLEVCMAASEGTWETLSNRLHLLQEPTKSRKLP